MRITGNHCEALRTYENHQEPVRTYGNPMKTNEDATIRDCSYQLKISYLLVLTKHVINDHSIAKTVAGGNN